MDLKCFGDRTYILWMVDNATRLIRGQVIQDKEPDTIIAAIHKIWINRYGLGPGLPSKAFYSDNGGEFVNQKLLNLCQAQGITLKTTSSYSPQQNGLNERNHGLVDIMVEKIR
jgi:transposase InsO family protein